ncbi:anti-sigma factor family protein [Streptomyces sp. NPDC002676]
MSGDMTCEKLREIGAELALGVLPGRERAEAVAHLDGCADCREYVEQLTLVGDSLIGLLPDSEPPAGFDARVARKLAQDATAEAHRRARTPGLAYQGFRGRARRARLRIAAVASAFAIACGFAGWGIGTAVQAITASPPAAVETEPVVVGDMMPAAGGKQPVGEVYAHPRTGPGAPGWVFVSVALTGPATRYTGTVTCFLERSDGTAMRLGDFALRDGQGNWGVAAPVDSAWLSGARLTSPDGTVLATARLELGQVVTPA